MAATRVEVRLACLSHAELLKIAASGMHEGDETCRLGEAILAERAPVPEWAVTGVLTSVDLVRPLLASLALDDCYTALVCTAWRAAWKDRMKHMLRPSGVKVIGGDLDDWRRFQQSHPDSVLDPGFGYIKNLTPLPEGLSLIHI